jgi:LuxR family maltose regulon positive regulatory protein
MFSNSEEDEQKGKYSFSVRSFFNWRTNLLKTSSNAKKSIGVEDSKARRDIVYNTLLMSMQGKEEVAIQVGSPSWYSWLETATSFTFRNEAGSFTAQKKRASSQRGGWYWYAYRRRHGQLFCSYLGASSKLTLERLRDAAEQLALRSEVANQGTAVFSVTSDALPSHFLERDQTSLLTTKLHIPGLPVHHISRSRLISELDQGTKARLTLVSAPAGAGKTTLLAEWARAADVPVAWLSLEEADDDPLRFLSYLIAALTRLDFWREEQNTILPLMIHGSSWQEMLTPFVNDLASILTRDAVLILDDYHLVTAEPIHTTLRFLIEHAPAHLHLLIGTRFDPPLPLARMRARGQLSEIRIEGLRFVSQEVQAFLRAMELDLTQDMQDVLEQHTQGWIVGIQLLALALRGQTQSTNLLQAQPGTHPFFLEYVSEEFLAHFHEDARRFLLHTGILDRMTGALCEAITGLPDGQARLAKFYQENLLIYPLDDTGTWYSYHPLFAEALRTHLHKLEPNVIPDLYRRASLCSGRAWALARGVRRYCGHREYHWSAGWWTDH